MIQMNKVTEGEWIVWNKKTGLSANIIKIKEYGILARSRPLYRVDFKGVTEHSMIEHFQSAKGKAFELVK